MMRKQNPGESALKLSPSEEPASVQSRFNKPSHAIVFPAKRKSVKRLMFDDFVQFIANAFCPRNEPNCISFKKTRTKTVSQKLGLINVHLGNLCYLSPPISIYSHIGRYNKAFVVGIWLIVNTQYSSMSFLIIVQYTRFVAFT